MNSNEKDRIWIFASTLFAIFLLFVSGVTIQHTDARSAGALAKEGGEDVWSLNNPLAAGEGGFDREFVATAYSDYGITKSGVVVATGIVAADPAVLPIGSIIEIDTDDYSGIYTVMDTGAQVKGEKIDIFIPDYQEALRFGTRKVAVRVLRHGWNP